MIGNVIHAAIFRKPLHIVPFSLGKSAYTKTKCFLSSPQKNHTILTYKRTPVCYDTMDDIGEGIMLTREQSREFVRAMRAYLDRNKILKTL